MKNWTQVLAGEINAANQRLWVAFGDNADDVATRINTDPAFVANMARLMVNGGFEPSTSQKLAREIMGKNFFGVEEAIKHFGVNPSKQQLAFLAEIPWSEEVLRACKDTHVLIVTFALSILDIRGIVKKLADQTLFYKQDWYDKQAFAADKGEIGWQLVRKEPIANSTSKTWNEQQALLSKDEETPKARVVVQTAIGHFLATGERLFEKVYVRCADLDSDGLHVYVGYFGAEGLGVNDYWDDNQYDNIGVSAARKQ
jgi:hypothetical protein